MLALTVWLHNKSVLYKNGTIWSKKTNDTLFDINTGNFYGSDIFELVGLYLLDNIKDNIDPKHISLYRDDRLAIVNNYSNADLTRVCKKLRRSIKDIGFNITIESGLKRTNFRDITLDLTKDIQKT